MEETELDLMHLEALTNNDKTKNVGKLTFSLPSVNVMDKEMQEAKVDFRPPDAITNNEKRKSAGILSFRMPSIGNKEMDETEEDFLHLEALTNKDQRRSAGILSLRIPSVNSVGKEMDKRRSAGIKTEKLLALTRNNSAELLDAGMERGEIEKLKRDFENADKNNDGYIDAEEFRALYAKHRKALKVVTYHVQVSCIPPPMFIICMSTIQAIIYTIHHYSTPNNNSAYCSYLIMDICRRGQIWRYITYALVHSGHGHILFNILFKCLVGIPLEMSQPGWSGKGRVALVYFFGTLLGSLGGSLTNSNVTRFHAGSSAGVYALIAAYLASLILNWKEEGMSFLKSEKGQQQEATLERSQRICRDDMEQNPELHPIRLHRNLRLAKFVFVISYASLDTYSVIKDHVDGVETSAGTMGHFMGFIGGLLMGIVFLKNWKEDMCEKPLKVICLVMYCLLGLILVILQGEGSLLDYPSPSNTTACPVNCTYSVLLNLQQTKCQIFNLEAGGCFSTQDDSHF